VFRPFAIQVRLDCMQGACAGCDAESRTESRETVGTLGAEERRQRSSEWDTGSGDRRRRVQCLAGMVGLRAVQVAGAPGLCYHPRRCDDRWRPGFQISPHASQRQYVDDETALVVVATRVDSQNGHFVTGAIAAGAVSPGTGGLSQRAKLMGALQGLDERCPGTVGR
jgi:hypothetical protein